MKTINSGLFKAMVVVALSLGISAGAQTKTITGAQLPAAVKAFVKNNFKGETIKTAWEDKEIFDTDYKVLLSNGIEIEFDDKGNWDEIDGNGKALPASVIPKGISTYIDQHYKGQMIVQIDTKRSGYEVELANGPDLEFSQAGKFIRIDD
jgi:hypothetical protein